MGRFWKLMANWAVALWVMAAALVVIAVRL